MFRRACAVVLLTAAALAAPMTAALANDPSPACDPQVFSQYCDGPADPGIPAGFIALIVCAAVIGVAVTVWRISTARGLARDAGMDPGQATAVTLLGNDGLDAAYVAAAVRTSHRSQQQPPVPRDAADTEARLRELTRLHEAGLLTDTEYQQRRTVVINQL